MKLKLCGMLLLSLSACMGRKDVRTISPDQAPDPDPKETPVDGGQKPAKPNSGSNPGVDHDPGLNALPTRLPAIRQEGRYWVDSTGQRLRLRGTNLGNWLQLEFWMMDTPMSKGNVKINDQCTLEDELEKRFGAAEKERLMAVFRDSWMTTRDWDNLKALGFNLVRLPFMYNLVEDQYHPYQLRKDAWVYIDRAIDEAEKRGMYTLVDLHGAVGSQGWEHHSGCAGKNQLWGSTEFRNRTKWLWKEIAKRYKDRAAVAAYGLLNEPWGTDATTLAQFSTELYRAIREIDTKHVVILPGHDKQGIDAYGDPAQSGMQNVALEMHFYPGFFGWGDQQDAVEVHRDWLFCDTAGAGGACDWEKRLSTLNAAFLVGEFQPWTALGAWGPSITRIHYDAYNARGWAATSWSYKTVSKAGSSGRGWNWGLVTNRDTDGKFSDIDISTASMQEIEAYFRRFATQGLLLNDGIRETMNLRASAPQRIEAEHFAYQSGVRIEKCAAGGLNASNLDDKDWMSYPVEVPEAGTYRLELRVASPYAGGRVILGRKGKDLAALDVPNTNGWQSWQTITVPVQLEAGSQDLTIWVEKGGWNLDWWSLGK